MAALVKVYRGGVGCIAESPADAAARAGSGAWTAPPYG